MKWKVTGADASTGADRTVEIDAPDQAAAEALARYNGMLISDIAPAASASVMDYAHARAPDSQTHTLAPPPLEQAVPSRALAGEEVLLENSRVLVTDVRVVVDQRSYSVANITSVEAIRVDPQISGWLISMLLVGILFLIFSFLQFSRDDYAAGLAMLVISLGCIGGFVAILWSFSSVYVVRLCASSGQTDALSDRDIRMIDAIVEAINRAMILRSNKKVPAGVL